MYRLFAVAVLGFAGFFRLFGRCIPFTSRGAKRHGFTLVSRHVQSRTMERVARAIF